MAKEDGERVAPGVELDRARVAADGEVGGYLIGIDLATGPDRNVSTIVERTGNAARPFRVVTIALTESSAAWASFRDLVDAADLAFRRALFPSTINPSTLNDTDEL